MTTQYWIVLLIICLLPVVTTADITTQGSERLKRLIQAFQLDRRQIYAPNLGWKGIETTTLKQPEKESSKYGASEQDGPTILRMYAGFRVMLSELTRGRVDVKRNEYIFNVCDEGLGDSEAKVLCRMADIDDVNHAKAVDPNNYEWGPNKVEIADLRCNGDELDIESCYYKGYTDCTTPAAIDCYAGKSPPKPPPSPIQEEFTKIRIVQGDRNNRVGFVEVYFKGEWGSVCSDLFDDLDATVVCRQVHQDDQMIGEALLKGSQVFGGYTRKKVWLDNVECYGTESNLNDCDHLEFGQDNCEAKYETAAVICRFAPNTEFPPPLPQLENSRRNNGIKDVRLYGGQSDQEGYVQFSSTGRWLGLCSDDISEKDAQVICRQIGFRYVQEVVPRAHRYFAPVEGQAFLRKPECLGEETEISQCKLSLRPRGKSCDITKDPVAIVCSGPIQRTISPTRPPGSTSTPPLTRRPSTIAPPPPVRDQPIITRVSLHPINSAMANSGFVLVEYDGGIGSVCSEGFDDKDATVLCKMIDSYYNEGTYLRQVSAQHSVPPSRHVILSGLECTGSERTVNDCPHMGINNNFCRATDAVAIRCTK